MHPAQRFLAMHHGSAPLVLPNAWDAGSARVLEQVGFAALATTSAGIAFSLARPDGSLTRAEALEHAAQIIAAVDCPVTVDLEAGYGEHATDVAATVSAAAAAGAVGANIEDARPGPGAGLFTPDAAAARLEAARDAAPAGTFVLNARIDSYLAPVDDALDDSLARAERYVAAGADCIFVPGVDDAEDIRRLASAIDAPLNVVAGLTGASPDVAALGALGVARVSVGGSLARAALAYVERAGREMLEDGTFGFTRETIPHGDLQRRFAR